MPGQVSAWNRFGRDFLEVLEGSEADFLEVCFGRIPYGNFHTKATSKKSGPPSGNFCLNPPELPRSPSRSFSSDEAGWKTLLTFRAQNHNFKSSSLRLGVAQKPAFFLFLLVAFVAGTGRFRILLHFCLQFSRTFCSAGK